MSSHSSSASLRICVVSTMVRPPAASPRELLHDAALEDRIHAGRELVEEDDRRVDHEHLGHLHAAPEAAAQVHHLAVRFGASVRSRSSTRSARGWISARAQPVKPREGGEVVAHREEQLDRRFLNHDRDAPPHVERSRRRRRGRARWPRPKVGRDSVERMRRSVVLPAPFGPSRPKIEPRATSNVRSSRARTGGSPARVYNLTRPRTPMAGSHIAMLWHIQSSRR